ncbi:MAG: right-handed parallel beta-helix repeat-containing protein [Methanobacterium sp.]|nr:right-handed parallel beta-helix repeat-containing protein [Methanobacterium sp.]
MNFKNKMTIFSLLLILVSVSVTMAGPVSAKTIYVQDQSYYSGNSQNEQIQSLLDAAELGDTVKFMGLFYENLHLSVNKKLNITSTKGTVINSSSSLPVFLINGLQASGTQISGFTIDTKGSSGIYVNNTRKTVISDNQLKSTNGSAVKVNGSSNTYIENNKITGSDTGIEIKNSKNSQINGNNLTHNQNGVTLNNAKNTTINNTNISDNTENGLEVDSSAGTTVNQSNIENNGNNGVAISNSNRTIVYNSTVKGNGKTSNGNGVSIKSSDKVIISNSQITENYDGINSRDVSELIVVYNYILENNNDGIELSGVAKNVQIAYNKIQRNLYGIKLDSSSNNLNITGNLITEQIANDIDPLSGAGISFESNYIQTSTNIIEHNAIYGNQGKNADARNSNEIYSAENLIPIGSNWYGTNDQLGINVCCMVKSSATQLQIIRTGYDTYAVIFVDGDTGEIESDLPSLMVKISKNDAQQVQYVYTTNGTTIGTLLGDKNRLAYVAASAGQSTVYGEWGMEISSITAPFSKTRTINYFAASGDEEGSDDTPGSGTDGPGTSDSGTNSGNNPTSSDSSGSSSNNGVSSGVLALGTAAAASAAGSSSSQRGSSDTGTSQSKTAQELIIDEINQKSQFWGIIPIIILIIVVLGAYYHKDIMNMVEKSKK